MVQLLDRPPSATERVAVHAVGTAPTATRDPLDTMQWHLDHRCGATLTALPIDTDPRWIIDWLDTRAEAPGLRQVRAGDSRGYDRVPSYAVEDEHDLTPASVALGRPQLVAEAFAARAQLIGDAIPEQLQVSVPNALDLSFFVAGSAEAAPQWMPAVQTMLAGEIGEIAQRWGDRVRLQLESPAVLMRYHQTPREAWPEATEQLVAQVSSVLAVAPSADWVLHLCYGDLEHLPLFTPGSLDAPVLFLNALEQRLEEMRIAMPVAHIPVAYGDAAPPADPAYYEVLRQLRNDIHVIAGVVAEHHPEASAVAAAAAADALGGRLTAVAAACGLGRRSPEDAAANHRLSARIAAFLTTSVRRRAA
ncbi:MAG TPA: hypothetical protein VGL02_30285 [Streptomyces sp.]